MKLLTAVNTKENSASLDSLECFNIFYLQNKDISTR